MLEIEVVAREKYRARFICDLREGDPTAWKADPGDCIERDVKYAIHWVG